MNHWYQGDEPREAIDAAVRIASAFERVVAYGSSMGGFAALHFAKVFNAATVLALMPQYSIDRSAVPFETRWALEASRITFDRHPMADVPKETRAFVFYDPFHRLDCQQANLVSATTGCERISLPLMGHNGPGAEVVKCALLLAQQGMEERIPAEVRRVYREHRRNSSNYYIQLAAARHLSPTSRIELLERAKVLGNDVNIDISLSEVLMREGRVDEAIAVQREALTRYPGSALMWSRLAGALLCNRDLDGALLASTKAIEIAPDNAFFHHQVAGILTQLKQHSEAVQYQQRAMLLDGTNAAYAKQMDWILAKAAADSSL